MNVSSIIVTYANRFEFCKEVVTACWREGVSRIIVVDNCSSQESFDALKRLEQEHHALTVISLAENTGSAGGYKRGFEEALKDKTLDYFWLLDDDNVPEKGALRALCNANNLFFRDDHGVVLYSYRGNSRQDDFKAVTSGIIKRYKPNNFCGFNFSSSLSSMIRNIFSSGKKKQEVNYPIIRVKIGPYGGMFIHHSVVTRIGFPREELFVYADDHEFSTRLDKLGIDQYLVFQSNLKDIDVSFPEGSSVFSSASSELKLFYSIRNHTYLSHLFIDDKLFYQLNKIFFVLRLLLSAVPFLFQSPRLAIRRLNLIFGAIRDGDNKKLGRNI